MQGSIQGWTDYSLNKYYLPADLLRLNIIWALITQRSNSKDSTFNKIQGENLEKMKYFSELFTLPKFIYPFVDVIKIWCERLKF